MGLDAEIWARVDSITRDQTTKLLQEGVIPSITVMPAGDLLVRVRHGDRYFSDGYPHGHWPSIHRDICAMQRVFSDVYYTSDDTEWDTHQHLVWTEARSEQCWETWREVQRG